MSAGGFSASIPVASMLAANTSLAALGFGPNSFSVPTYTDKAVPTYAILHSWGNAAFEAAVAAISGVTITHEGTDPIATAKTAATTIGGAFAASAKPLTGTVTPGLYMDSVGTLWLVIQSYNTATWPNPSAPGLTAIVVPARTPGEVVHWYQTFAPDAFKLVNPFTGTGDVTTYGGKTYKVTDADSSGNNVWTPGVFGWTIVS
jgi:hypothetical protein